MMIEDLIFELRGVVDDDLERIARWIQEELRRRHRIPYRPNPIGAYTEEKILRGEL